MTADMVNHPPHYTRGPSVRCRCMNVACASSVIECIEVIRHITDMRLANAMKYIWRVAFGGKDNDREDIQKAIFYLNDWLDNPIERVRSEDYTYGKTVSALDKADG